MKKFLAVITATILMATSTLAANVMVNGELLDQEAAIVDGRTLVPVRGVFEKLGYSVSYDADTKTATLTKGSDVLSMTLGNTYFTHDGEQITPEVPQQIINDRFMLPLRAVGESIGAGVSWNAETKTAIITKAKGLIVIKGPQTFDDAKTDVVEVN